MKNLARVSLLLLCTLALPLSAQTMDWSTVASAGIIDEDSQALYAFNTFALEFKAGQVGTITARYPLMHTGDPTPPWSSITVGGYGPGVTVKLMRASKCIPVIPETMCTIGASTNNGNWCSSCETAFSALDFVNNAYYWEATLTRSSTGTTPKLFMIAIN